jgi:hypothetical protein
MVEVDFKPEDRGSIFLQNVGSSLNGYNVSQPRRQDNLNNASIEKPILTLFYPTPLVP